MELSRSIILVKLETVRGTDVTPAVSANEIIVHGTPDYELVTRALSRPVPLPYFGELAPVIIGEAMKLSFKCELTPSATAGTAPRVGCILRAANLTEAITSNVSVAYTPHSTFLGETISIYFWAGGTKHILTGGVANVKIVFQAGEFILLDVEVTGVYGGTIADVTFPTPTFETTAPLVWTAANFKFNSVTTLVCSKMDFDFGNEIATRKDANASNGIASYFIKDRKPKVSFEIEKEALSTLNPWTLHTAQTLVNLESKPTATTPRILEFLVNNIALDAPKYGENDKMLTWPLSGAPKVSLSAGNGEFSITLK